MELDDKKAVDRGEVETRGAAVGQSIGILGDSASRHAGVMALAFEVVGQRRLRVRQLEVLLGRFG